MSEVFENKVNPSKVVCGKFFDCEKILTLREAAELEGGIYDDSWKDSDDQLVRTFRRDGFSFLGCVRLKEELSEALADSGVYWGYAYMVRGNYLVGGPKRTYLVVDVWDESRGQGDHRAYRYNLLTCGSWEYKEANRAYKRVCKN